jgi:AcrR family transcriptional regulator
VIGPETTSELASGQAEQALARALADAAARPMRADAQRNRARVLDAAREVFAQQGVDAGMEAIAQRASVGVGTVYRHFATKEALIEALIEVRFAEMRDALERALEAPDAWEAMTGYLEHAASLAAADQIYGEMNDPREIPCVAPIIEQMLGLWAKLIERAQEQGKLRNDFDARDIPAIMCGLCNVSMTARTEADWRRYLEIVVTGLRASDTGAKRRTALTAR